MVQTVTSGAGPGVYEFFAGGGMARAGLGETWRTLFANDFDPMKGAAYARNWGGETLLVGDVHALTTRDLPGQAALAWASSPCQDLSLAGRRVGLDGARSGAFFGFWRLMQALEAEGRGPSVVVIENVTGLFTSNKGDDFTTLCQALADAGYRFGAVELDAAHFLPQSRPRMFMVASRTPGAALISDQPLPHVHSRRLVSAFERLPEALQRGWCWWRLPHPPRRNTGLADLLEPDSAIRWHSAEQTAEMLELLAPLQRLRLDQILARRERTVGALFRRTRPTAHGRAQRAEVRFDGLAGCLRTSGGGSSRQFILLAEDGRVRTRQMTPREAARLMGLPDSYVLPERSTAALHLVGDGVAAPVVAFLSQHLLLPLAGASPLDDARPAAAPRVTTTRKVFP